MGALINSLGNALSNSMPSAGEVEIWMFPEMADMAALLGLGTYEKLGLPDTFDGERVRAGSALALQFCARALNQRSFLQQGYRCILRQQEGNCVARSMGKYQGALQDQVELFRQALRFVETRLFA